MSKGKIAQIEQSQVHKAYWQSTPQTRMILKIMFPFLKRGIYLHDEKNVSFEEYKGEEDELLRRYYYVYNNKVTGSFIIERSKLKYYHKRIKLYDIPPEFLKKVGFFKVNN